jgi:peptidyl-prolyl cis-trans isomerase A (cyclophilin A)
MVFFALVFQRSTRPDLSELSMQKFARILVHLTFISLILLGISMPARAQTIICLETTIGDICMELLETEAPVTAQNFLAYVSQGSFRNSFFHLGVKGSPAYVQAGRYADTGAGNISALQEIFRRPAIGNETSVANTRATVASVRDDANNPNSVTSQYLINVIDNPELDDGSHTVFARIIADDMNVVDLLAGFPLVSLAEGGLSQVPVVGQEVPVFNSPRVLILDAYVFDGEVCELEAPACPDGADGGDGSTDGGDGGTDGGDGGDGGTPTPGEGETLYEDAVCVDTNVGEFCMELLPEAAPETVENFLNYVTSGRYDDTIVHRSVPSFVIQAGGYSANPLGAGIQRDGTVINEFSLSNSRGTVAMARLGGQVNSATSEWFVNLVNNAQLDSVDGGFTVFARIISGMSVVDAIGNLPRTNQQNSLGNAFGELPLTDQDNDGLQADDLVLVHRVYVTDVIVDDAGTDTGGGDGSTDDGATTTATYSAVLGTINLPVYINDTLYRVILARDFEASGVVFRVDTTRIYYLADVGQETATMELDAGTLYVPSINVLGTIVTDVEFKLVDYETLTFKLRSFTLAAD